MVFKERLNDLIKKEGITPYKLAKKTGLNQGMIDRYVKGVNLPDAKNLLILATYFGVRTDYLLGYDTPTVSINNDIENIGMIEGINKGQIVFNNGDSSPDENNITHEEAETLKLLRGLNFVQTVKVKNLIVSFHEENKRV